MSVVCFSSDIENYLHQSRQGSHQTVEELDYKADLQLVGYDCASSLLPLKVQQAEKLT